MSTRIAVVSDTHAPRFWKSMPLALAEHLTNVDFIFHAGDVCLPSVLDELAQFAPVYVVRGNNDGDEVAAWGALPSLEVVIDGVCFGLIHDSGTAVGRLARMQKLFPTADCVVFGHSHIPFTEVDIISGFQVFNPGSPTDKRRQPERTMGLITVDAGVILSAEIVDLVRPALLRHE